MKATYCDNCGTLIKPNEFKHVLGICSFSEKEEPLSKGCNNAFEVLQYYANKAKEIKSYEICEGCFQILGYLFKLRQDEVKKLKIEANNILSLQEKAEESNG